MLVVLRLPLTGKGFARERIFSTTFNTKHECSNLQKKVSTEAGNPLSCKTLVIASGDFHRPCKPLSILGFRAIKCRLCVAFFIFLKRWKFFKNNFVSDGEKQALLQTLVCVLACAVCKCTCFCAIAFSSVKTSV